MLLAQRLEISLTIPLCCVNFHDRDAVLYKKTVNPDAKVEWISMALLGKKTTIWVFPPGACQPQKYAFPRRLPFLAITFGVFAFVGLLLFSAHVYVQDSQFGKKDRELRRLRQKAARQGIQIYAFNDKIRLLEQEMAKLRQFDLKLQAMGDHAPSLKEGHPLAIGGSETENVRPEVALKADPANLIRQMHRELDRLLAEASVQEQNQHLVGKFFQDTKSIIASNPDTWPLQGSVTSSFGYRKSPFSSRTEFHRGIDIRAPKGTSIVAAADGRVVSIDWNSGYGLILTINHGYGMVTRYAHLSRAYVKAGQRVRRGQKVAAVGMSGRTTGPHLHFETILNGVPVNPTRFLSAKNE